MTAMTDQELRDWAIATQIAHLQAAKQESIMFRLQGSVVAKARPRMNTNTGDVYMPSNYKDWKDTAIRELVHVRALYPQYTFPLQQANIMYVFDGKHSRKNDGDNSGGSCADALVQAGILREDNFLVVPEQLMMLNHCKTRSPSTLIVLY